MRPWQQIPNQHQKLLRDLREAKAKGQPSGNLKESTLVQLESWIDSLKEANGEELSSQLEAFKKIVFKMLNGKKKTVEAPDEDDDELGESTKPSVVPSAKNKAGLAPTSKNAKALLKGTGNEKGVGSATSTAKLILSKRFGS